MSGASSIEWTDATWSPVVGCTRVSSGCDHCYAARQTKRLAAMGQEKYAGLVNEGKDHFNGVARLHAPALDWPLRWRGAKAAKDAGRPSRIFVNPMSDLFHERLSDEDIAAVFGVMAACPQHTFQVLTKRPERMRKWFEAMAAQPGMIPHATVRGCGLALSRKWAVGTHPNAVLDALGDLRSDDCPPWPLPNVWIGVSVEDQATADERIPLLLQTPAAVRFVSYEPALGAVDFRRLSPNPRASWMEGYKIDALGLLDPGGRPARRLDWLIVGGESGPGARPFDLAWARSTVEQCRVAGVACFVKQFGARPFASAGPLSSPQSAESIVRNGEYDPDPFELRLRDRKGGDWSEWPEDLRVREMPR